MNANGTTNGAAHGELVPGRPHRTLSLADARQLTPAPQGVGAWAEKLREAAYDAVKEQDVQELIKGLMEKAKAGDLKAAKFVMDFLTGGAPKVQLQQVFVHRRTKTSQRQRVTRDEDPGPRPNRDLDAAVRAGSPPAVPEAPSVKVYRRLAARFLLQNGPTPGPALVEQLDLGGSDELDTVMEHEWFALKKGEWHLTTAGKQAVG